MAKPSAVSFDLLLDDSNQDLRPAESGAAFPADDDATAPIASPGVARSAAAMFKRSTLLSRASFSLLVPYVVKGWLFADQTSIVYAPSIAGKTSWVLDITRAITADQDWHGYRTEKGGAVFHIAAEAPGSIFGAPRFSPTLPRIDSLCSASPSISRAIRRRATRSPRSLRSLRRTTALRFRS